MKPEDYKIYKKPTVKTVVFQIKFSNMFIIENRIGEFQNRIINKFPESSLAIRRRLIFADVGPEFKMEELASKEQPPSEKIWKFSSEDKYEMNVLTNSVDITSKKHKSYYSNNKEDGFREIIEFSIKNFLELIPITIIKRIGLRYIDEAPIPSEDKEMFEQWYNTSFPLKRFGINEVGTMLFEALNTKRGKYEFNYRESLVREKIEDSKELKLKFYLDFDGYAGNIPAKDYLIVLDDLHELIHNEWNKTIKQPVKDWMDNIKEGK